MAILDILIVVVVIALVALAFNESTRKVVSVLALLLFGFAAIVFTNYQQTESEGMVYEERFKSTLAISPSVQASVSGAFADTESITETSDDTPRFAAPTSGDWQLTTVAGHKMPAKLAMMSDGRCILGSGGVLSGIYRWADNKLTVETPSDERMNGLVWGWADNKLVLTAEPAGTPTGSSYVGATLHQLRRLQSVSPPASTTPTPGGWQLTTASGHTHAAKLNALPNDRYLLNSGGVLSGTYHWTGSKLTVETPSDKRMTGLVWEWSGDKLTLTAETVGTPTGSSYLGATLELVKTAATADKLPSERPDWVDKPGRLKGSVYQVSVGSGPFVTDQECSQALPQKIQAVIEDYANNLPGHNGTTKISFDAELIRRVQKATHVETQNSSVGPMRQIYALVEFDDAARKELNGRWQATIVAERLWRVAMGSSLVLTVLAVAFGYLKLDARRQQGNRMDNCEPVRSGA